MSQKKWEEFSQTSNALSSSTVAHDVLHHVGQLPRQNLAIEVGQHIVSAVCPEFLRPPLTILTSDFDLLWTLSS